MAELSLFRLYLLRIGYGFLAFALGAQIYPRLLGATAAAPFNEGVVDVMLAALAILALLGLIAPMRMLPVLVFEVVWKSVWFAAVVLPQWLGEGLTADTQANLFAIALVVPYILIIPWGRFLASVGAERARWR